MLFSKKISGGTSQKTSRKTLQKLLEEFFPSKTDPFKNSSSATTLILNTAALIHHFSIADMWRADTHSQLNKTISQAVDSNEAALSNSLDAAFHEYIDLSLKHGPAFTLSFEQKYPVSGNVWHHGSMYELAVKGAPEYVLAKCDLTENEREVAEQKLHSLAGNGHKVLAVAHLQLTHEITSFNDLTKQDRLVFDGFVSLTQASHPHAKKIVKAAQQAGMTVYLMTGDHLESALHIAKELGIATRKSHIFDSRRAHVMTNEELEQLVKDVRVFSRITPQNKARFVALLKSNT
jgi:magnesium-transporting ATPase (P-type)